MATKKRPLTRAGRPRARRGVKLKPTELTPPDLSIDLSIDLGPGKNGPLAALAGLAAEVKALMSMQGNSDSAPVNSEAKR